MKSKRSSELYDQLHESISYMEQYVSSARRQLRRESDVREFTVSQELERVVDFMRPKAEAMQIHIKTTLNKGLVVSGDSVKFNQIISNLLANAIDAYESLPSGDSQPINVVAGSSGRQLIITVTDHGVGIPRKLIGHVFDPFYTTKIADRGTGLGLTITKRTVEEDFGGVISVTSTKQNGTCFKIRIPLS
jgi:signal transduction histidine kinase